MASPETRKPRATASRLVAVAAAAVIGVALGLFGSIFGPYYAMAAGMVAAVAGVIGTVRAAAWGRVLLALGAGIIVGAALYITIGVLTPDGAGSTGGYGCAPGGSCE